uniref:Uncharacterized protein n=1 Tax=Neogobius melanostomus TaxID=47308 RepID=A0A8C6ULN9_9GOBI
MRQSCGQNALLIVRIWRKQNENMDPSCLVTTVQAGGGGVMVWGMFSWHTLGPLVPIGHRLNATDYLSIVSDHIMVNRFLWPCPWRSGVVNSPPPPQRWLLWQRGSLEMGSGAGDSGVRSAAAQISLRPCLIDRAFPMV